jgi:3-phenylpropionate/cinnamic acid dioxygenase small subunit
MSAEDDLLLHFQKLLTREAWIRDNEQFDEWLKFFTDDCRYWAPVRMFLDREAEDFTRKDQMTHIDEDKQGLALRFKRLSSGLTYTDEPPARTRRMISNVQLLEHDGPSAKVLSYFMIFRSHPGHTDTLAIGYRRDHWLKSDDGWKIKERMIVLDQDRLQSYLGLL